MAMADEVVGSHRSGRLTVVAWLALLVGRRPCNGEHRASAGAVAFESAGDRSEPGRKCLWCHWRLAAAGSVLNTAHALRTEAGMGDPRETGQVFEAE
jgi:hypothetical protein